MIKENKTVCLILAAGYATRMYPLCENFPKPLLEVGSPSVGHKTILGWLVDDVHESCGIGDFVLVSNHRFLDHFTSWTESKKKDAGISITVLDDGSTSNDNRLGAVKDIEFAIESLGLSSDLLVLAGDNVLDFSFKGFVSYARSKGTTCIMRYHEPNTERLYKCGVVEIDADDRILSMEEKPAEPKSHWCCPPFYYYRKEDLPLVSKGIAEGCGTDAPGSFIAWLCTQTTVHAWEMPAARHDIGSLETYKEACRIYEGKGKRE